MACRRCATHLRVTDQVAVVTADVSQPEDVRQMINTAAEQYGRLDIAVANAGTIPLASVVEATPQDWDEVMAISMRLAVPRKKSC